MKFETIIKSVSKGTKRKVTILADGVEIGSRTSAHTYRFALVVKGNQAHAVKRTKESIVYLQDQVNRYSAIASKDEGAIQYQAFRNGIPRESVMKSIENGDYSQWTSNYHRQLETAKARLAELLHGPQPEFELPLVVSWHSRRDLVPEPMAHQIFVAVVEIPA